MWEKDQLKLFIILKIIKLEDKDIEHKYYYSLLMDNIVHLIYKLDWYNYI